MNTYQRNLQDQASAEAKRADSAVVDVVHVAAAIAVSLQDPALPEIRARARLSASLTSNASSITADAETLLGRSVDDEHARVVLQDFLSEAAITTAKFLYPPRSPT